MSDDSGEAEQPAEAWMYPYFAGTFDSGGGVYIKVRTREGQLGYGIEMEVRITTRREAVLGMFDEFCMEHGWQATIVEGNGSPPRASLFRRDDIIDFLQAIAPFVVGRARDVYITLNEILPRLDAGAATDRELFLETMVYVDAIRGARKSRGVSPEYDAEHFAEEWDMDLPPVELPPAFDEPDE